MSDEDLITQAYEKVIKNPVKNFCDAYTASNSSIQAKPKQGLATLPNENPLIHLKFMQTLPKPSSILNKKE